MNKFIGKEFPIQNLTNSVLIGHYAGADLTEGDGIVIIGDNVRSLDKSQEDVLFLGEKVAFGTKLFGKEINIKKIMEEYINDPKTLAIKNKKE